MLRPSMRRRPRSPRPQRLGRPGPALLAPLVLWAACSGGGEDAARPADEAGEGPGAAAGAPAGRTGPPTAKWDVVDMLRESRDLPHHPADGGGRARLERAEGQPPFTVAATPDRFRIVFEVGPRGIATGGGVYFQVSPFWEWSTPQVVSPDAPGYTEVTPRPDDIRFRAETVDQQLLLIEVTGRPLVEGDRLEIVYGAGRSGAMTDRYAERDSPFWIGVDGDGDGDGTRRWLRESPTIDVHPRDEVASLLVTLPTIARPGEPFRVALAFIDGWRNAGLPVDVEVEFVDPPEALEIPETVVFRPADRGTKSVEAVAREPGVYRLRAVARTVRAESNPLVVSQEGPRVLWGDLHGHSNFSDGTGIPEDYFTYARDVTALDVVSLTDHDHWGILPLVDHEELWREIRTWTRRFHEPGRFVTLLGFEWTNWIHGHRHVLYFDDDGPLVDSVDPETDSPPELWDALEGQRALTFAHHSAGGPIATNWDFAPDPRFEPVTEIVSVHGSSEAPDSPGLIYSPVDGNFVRDALDRGYRLGFVGSGDRHDGHPGAYHVDPPRGGLAAILSEERTREGVLAALRARRVYATNGPRILLRVALGDQGMGGTLSVPPGGGTVDESLFVRVVAETPLERVELVRSGAVVDAVALEGRLEVTLQRDVTGLTAGEYVYVRAVQRDQGTAWSSPIFVGEAPASVGEAAAGPDGP